MSSDSDSSNDDRKSKLGPSPNLIDHALDAIDNQFASVSVTQLEFEFNADANGTSSANQEQLEQLISESLNEITEAANSEELPHSNVVEEEPSSSTIMWRNNSELEETETPLSPSSSGYAGERGSSSSSSIDDAIRVIGSSSDSLVDGVSDSESQLQWLPGKRYGNEDDDSISWRRRKKHFFILSHSGKPIYSRYGDEHKLAGFYATLQAIISFVENGGDRVNLVRAGKHQVVFLVKGPIYLVCISCTQEPYKSLTEQLELLYGQMDAIPHVSVVI